MGNFDENQLLEQSIAYGEGCRQQRASMQAHMERLDEQLKCGDVTGFIKVFDELAQEPFAVCDEKLDYMSVVKTIYEKEVEDVTNLFLEHFTSVNDIMTFVTDFKFKIWRMEFNPKEDEEIKFYDWWNRQQLSIWALRILVQCYSMKKVDTLVILAIHRLEDKAYQESLYLLCDAEKLMPGNTMIVGAINQVMQVMGGTDGQ